jgi:hypothetical protein
MSAEVISQTLAAGVPAYFGQGSLFYYKSGTAALTVTARKSGVGSSTPRRFSNISPGAKIRAADGIGWDVLEVVSASGQSVEFVVGDDDFEQANAVSIVGGVATTAAPTSAINDTPTVVINAVSQNQLVPVNLARKRVTFCNDSGGVSSVYLRAGGSANNLYELQPGTSFTMMTTARVDAYNYGAMNIGIFVLEET